MSRHAERFICRHGGGINDSGYSERIHFLILRKARPLRVGSCTIGRMRLVSGPYLLKMELRGHKAGNRRLGGSRYRGRGWLGQHHGELGMAGEGVQVLFTEQAEMGPEGVLEICFGTNVSSWHTFKISIGSGCRGRASRSWSMGWSSGAFLST